MLAMHMTAYCLPENSILMSMIIHVLWSEFNKNFEVIMNLKRSTFALQDKNLKDLDNVKEYSTLADLMKEQGVSTDLANYWDKECELNPSNPHGLVYED